MEEELIYSIKHYKTFKSFEQAITECAKMSWKLQGLDTDLIGENITGFSKLQEIIDKYYDKYCSYSSFARETDPDMGVRKIIPATIVDNNEFNLSNNDTQALYISCTTMETPYYNLYSDLTIFKNDDGTFGVICSEDEDTIPFEYQDDEWWKKMVGKEVKHHIFILTMIKLNIQNF